MSDKNELVVTSGKKMREAREKGAVMPFPSGNNYRVRALNAAMLLKLGNLPNPLLSFTVDAFYNGVTQEKYDAFLSAADKAENALETMKSLAVVCAAMFMEPAVVEKPKADNETTIDDIPMEDQLWAFRLTFAGSEVLYPFRLESPANVERVPEPENVSQATKRRPGGRGQHTGAQSR